MHKICTYNDVCIQGDGRIAQASCDYFKDIITVQHCRIDDRILEHIPALVTPKLNNKLQVMPTLEKLRKVVFAMNLNSATRRDGLWGKYYHACWHVIKEDFLAAVKFFFSHIRPKFMSHACFVLLPKTEQPSSFKDLRPISLSNFSNMIISKLLSLRLATILSLLISEN